jgi:hypothetical protein
MVQSSRTAYESLRRIWMQEQGVRGGGSLRAILPIMKEEEEKKEG